MGKRTGRYRGATACGFSTNPDRSASLRGNSSLARGALKFEDRLAGIYVVSRLAAMMNNEETSEEAHMYLRSALAEANLQRSLAEEALKRFPGPH